MAMGAPATKRPPASAPSIWLEDFACDASAVAWVNSVGVCTSVGSRVACAGR